MLVSSMHWVLGDGYQLKLDEMEELNHVRKRVMKLLSLQRGGPKGPAAEWSS